MAIPEESASILQKIEHDLLSIKEELTALKNEIYSLRSGSKQADSGESKEEAESGFFEEDEDETIALTGDELDNILNTADITEQTGQSTASPEDADLLMEEAPEQSIIDRDDVLTEEIQPTAESEPLDLEGSGFELDESLADLASVTEEPAEELTLDEEAPSEDAGMLDLPEEEEIVFEEGAAEEALNLDETAAEPEEIELEPPEAAESPDLTFELDEELDLSPGEQQDLEAPEDLLEEGELEDLTEPEPGELDQDTGASELVEMEAEARETAPEQAEETIEEAFDLTDEDLEIPEIEAEAPATAAGTDGDLPEDLKSEIRAILKYMDQLLESLPEDKIEEFANSEYFEVYKRRFEELGLTT